MFYHSAHIQHGFRDSPTTTTFKCKNQLPEVVLLKATTTSTNDDIREIAQKALQRAWFAVLNKLKGEVNINGNGFHLKETFI